VTTLYDVSRTTYEAWPIPFIGFVIAAASPLLLWAPEGMLSLGAHLWGRRTSFLVVLGCGLAECAIASAITYVPYRSAIHALNAGRYDMVQGKLNQFDPGRSARPAEPQAFVVGGKRFEVDLAALAGFKGFGREQMPGITDPTGRNYRITYIDGNPPTILRVEMED
jgi:hypothetical protein